MKSIKTNRTCKRVLAAAMAAMLVVGALPAYDAQAAAKPKLSTTKKTMYVGDQMTLKVKNKPAKSSVTWKSSNKKYVAVNKRGVVRAVKAGNATITCKVKAAKTWSLKCKVTVKGTSQTVSTQSALETALKNKKVTKIVLKTDAAGTFKIPAGSYTKKELVIDAKNADVENAGRFKSIKVKNIKADTFYENASGNKLTVTAVKARVVLGKGVSVPTVAVTSKDADVVLVVETQATLDTVSIEAAANVNIVTEGTVANVNIESAASVKVEAQKDATVSAVNVNAANAKVDVVADGTVAKVAVAQTAEVNVSGSAKEVPVTVAKEATGTKVTASAPVKVEAAADIKVELEKGAEGSNVKATDVSAAVDVKNNTTEKVTVTTTDGDKDVAAGKQEVVKPTTPTNPDTPGSGGGTGGSTDSGSSTPDPTPETPATPAALTLSASVIPVDANGITHNEASDGTTSTLPQTKWNQSHVAAGTPVKTDDGNWTLALNGSDKNLLGFSSSVSAQGSGKWVALAVDTGVAAASKAAVYGKKAGGAWQQLSDANDDLETTINTGSTNFKFVWWAKASDLTGGVTWTIGVAASSGAVSADADFTDKTSITIKLDGTPYGTDDGYTIAVVSADKITHNEGGSSPADTTAPSKQNQQAVSLAKTADVVKITRNTAVTLSAFAKSVSDYTTGAWVALEIKPTLEDGQTVEWSTDGSSYSALTLPGPNEQAGDKKNQASAGSFWFWLNANDLTSNTVIRYMQIKSGGTVVKVIPVIVELDGELGTVASFPTAG